MPGVNIPSFPLGGAIFPGFSIQLPNHKDLQTEVLAADSSPLLEQTSNDARRGEDLQIGARKTARIRQKNCANFTTLDRNSSSQGIE
jgi:hypothetical protein